MKQSRATSLLKSCVSTVVGFGVAMVANALVLPLFGYTPTLTENVLLTTIYTAISIARGYALERIFEALGWRTRMSAFALAVLAERQRQIAVEGWTPEHDDEHRQGDLALAGVSYVRERAIQTSRGEPDRSIGSPPGSWPWSREWWKPTDYRRDMVKGCALILAEGERFDRQRKPKREPAR